MFAVTRSKTRSQFNAISHSSVINKPTTPIRPILDESGKLNIYPIIDEHLLTRTIVNNVNNIVNKTVDRQVDSVVDKLVDVDKPVDMEVDRMVDKPLNVNDITNGDDVSIVNNGVDRTESPAVVDICVNGDITSVDKVEVDGDEDRIKDDRPLHEGASSNDDS